MARWLRRLGHEVTVLTTSAFGTLADDAPWVVRTRDLQAPGLLRRALRRPEAPVTAGGAAERHQAAPRLLTDGLVPDAHVATWLPFVIPAARRLVRERHIDCVITNGPPDATHLAGLALGHRRPAWLVDLEDGWRFEPQRDGWPTRAQDRLDALLERRVLQTCDGVLSLSRPIAEDAAARVARRPARCRTAGTRMRSPPWPAPSRRGSSRVRSTSCTPARSRTPSAGTARAFFAGIGQLVATRPELAARLRLWLAGGLTAGDREVLAGLEPDVGALVRHLGPLPRPEAVALQRASDALLLVATGPQRSSVTGKVFEYLAAGRRHHRARERQRGRAHRPRDGDGRRRQCGRSGGRGPGTGAGGRGGAPYAPRGVDRYRFPAVAETMAAAVGAALDRRLHSPRS